jgi:hypothetical protein
MRVIDSRPVRLAYQPPASSTFLSEQISHQQPASSTFLSEQITTNHQPNEQTLDLLEGRSKRFFFSCQVLSSESCNIPPQFL